jgi:hypothetical protein
MNTEAIIRTDCQWLDAVSLFSFPFLVWAFFVACRAAGGNIVQGQSCLGSRHLAVPRF